MGLGAGVGFTSIYIIVLLVCLFVVRKRIRACEKQQWCSHCGTTVLASTFQINKKANIILSVMTLGIWLIVWACTIDLVTKEAPACPDCGEATDETAPAESSTTNPIEP